MNKNTRYRTTGNLALAYQEEGEPRFVLIKNGRARSAATQLHEHRSLSKRSAATRLSRPYSLQDVFEASYNPKRGILEGLGEAIRVVKHACSTNPLIYQLLHGSAKGNQISRDSIIPFALTSTICTAISLIAVFVGA